jgi:hypothetical protein
MRTFQQLRKIIEYFVIDILKNNNMYRLDEIDRIHDHNTTKFIECIKTSHDICGPDNFVAIKVTALIRPNVLKKFNTMLKSLGDRSLLPPLFELLNQEQTDDKTVAFLQQAVNSPLIKDQVILSE